MCWWWWCGSTINFMPFVCFGKVYLVSCSFLSTYPLPTMPLRQGPLSMILGAKQDGAALEKVVLPVHRSQLVQAVKGHNQKAWMKANICFSFLLTATWAAKN